MKNTKCYIYTRVSTTMQVEGYSLDAQKDRLRKYAEFQEMKIAGEYCDEGESGKKVEDDGREADQERHEPLGQRHDHDRRKHHDLRDQFKDEHF